MQAMRIVNESQVDRVAQLGKVALFAGLSEERLRALAAVCRVGVFPAGDEIVAQGHDAVGAEDGLYILLDGRETLIRLAEALLDREVLDSTEIKTLIEGGDLPPRPPVGGNEAPVTNVQVLKPETTRRPVTGAEPSPA